MVCEVDLDEWEKIVKKRTKNLEKPKRVFRSINSRSPEESDAIGYAVKRAWENALATGQLVKEADGSYTVHIFHQNDKEMNKQKNEVKSRRT